MRSSDRHGSVFVDRFGKAAPMEVGEWPAPPPVFVYDKLARAEDMPWAFVGCGDVVSSRLRAFLESEAPGVAEHLPIRLKGPRSNEIPERYWVTNWLRVFDCLHPRSYNRDAQGRRCVEVLVIDPARIPADGVLGMVEDFRVERIVRDDLRRKLLKARFTGVQFGRLTHVEDLPYVSWKAPKYGP